MGQTSPHLCPSLRVSDPITACKCDHQMLIHEVDKYNDDAYFLVVSTQNGT